MFMKSTTQNHAPHLLSFEGLFSNRKRAIWILKDGIDLQLQLCVTENTSASSHRGLGATEKTLSWKFTWIKLTTDINKFFGVYLQCLSATGRIRVPRPYGPALHRSKTNFSIQFDYLELGASFTAFQYFLMLPDENSNYSWLLPFENTNAEDFALSIVDLCAGFGIPGTLMPDGPSRFS